MSKMLFTHSNDCAFLVQITCLIVCLIKKVNKPLEQLYKKKQPSETQGVIQSVVSFVEENICALLMIPLNKIFVISPIKKKKYKKTLDR